MIILYNKQKNYYTNNDTNAKYLTQHAYKIRTISSWNISITIQRYFLAQQYNFLPSLTRMASEKNTVGQRHPVYTVYTHKGWDRWRKRTRALRNTRLAFCRAASAFIKESLAPSLSSASSSSASLASPLSFSLPPPLFSSFLSSFERISALRFFVLSSCYSPSSLAPFLFYNFPCPSLSLSIVSNGKLKLHREFSCNKISRKETIRNFYYS